MQHPLAPPYTSPRIHFPPFFFNHTATTEIYTLSLHDALPIFEVIADDDEQDAIALLLRGCGDGLDVRIRCGLVRDRKSTRLNSSHSQISYAVFCLKKKSNGCRQRLRP